MEMEPLYQPQGVEERWQRTWEDEGLYNADPDPAREPYVDAHPPPNVTGELHLGHALQLALGDTMCRLRRMQGFNVLFQPGYDHAGISTQNAVEKQLLAEGTSRQELGREAFEARVWAWLREYGGKIMVQFRRLGASLDYRRERFTMDPGYVRSVLRFFVHLYEKGYIYRANRIINWCPYHQTSLSDLELVHEDTDDTLSTIRYPLADGEGYIAIATVRIVDWCRERDLLEKREHYRHSVAYCERCHSRIEPLISLQWWCSMAELKQPALAALRERRVVYHPESQHRFAIDSLAEAPDW